VTKAELESKHLSELHALAAEAGVERYRMLPREELIEKLLDGDGGAARPSGTRSQPSRRSRRDGEERTREQTGERKRSGERRRGPREDREKGRQDRQKAREPRRRQPKAEPERQPEKPDPPPPEPAAAEPADVAAAPRPKRKRRRRRWGRRRKGVRVHDLLLPAAPGRQAIVYAESRAGCTTLLRELAAELSDADGADPIVLLVDPSPEELADWRREAPRAEIVAASQARHAEDAVAQATLRANGGESVVVLIDSLSRFAESFGGADEARDLFDAGRGSLTVVAAVERPQ